MPPQPIIKAAAGASGNMLPALSSVAERVRRHRGRRAVGLRSVALDVRNIEIEWLVHHNYLARHKADDADAIGRALGRLLDRLMSG